MMMDHMLLEGITLTAAQQTKLADLHKAEQAKMQSERGQQQGGRGDFEAIREARQKGDTATANRLMHEQRVKMEARRDEQIAAIRGILSGDQYAKFDANVAAMKQRQAQMGGRGRGARDGQHQGAQKP